jgi:hypothetical protein
MFDAGLQDSKKVKTAFYDFAIEMLYKYIIVWRDLQDSILPTDQTQKGINSVTIVLALSCSRRVSNSCNVETVLHHAANIAHPM